MARERSGETEIVKIFIGGKEGSRTDPANWKKRRVTMYSAADLGGNEAAVVHANYGLVLKQQANMRAIVKGSAITSGDGEESATLEGVEEV